MLYIVLLLVVAAFGLLITALTTANTVWAWLSVVVSVFAAGVLVYDWLGNRRAAAQQAEGFEEPDASEEDEFSDASHDEAEDVDQPAEQPAAAVEPVSPVYPVDEPDAAPALVPATDEVDEDAEPGEEPTDAADLLIVSDLDTEVRVVDERPRYHLARCRWLATRPTLPLPVAEARQLGFTPCGVCRPDSSLAQRHRSGRGVKRPAT